MAYVILDKQNCYYSEHQESGFEEAIPLFKSKESAERYISMYYSNKGYKTRYLKATFETKE